MTKTMLCCMLAMHGLLASAAIIKWDGEAHDGQWSSAANWRGNQVPLPSDQVILDNSLVTSGYTVTLPGGMLLTTVASLTITPLTGHTIEVILPSSNTATIGFSTSGLRYGLVINAGGIFRNASGAASGNAMSIADSLWIGNGGRYIHNTPRGHAHLVTVLSQQSGTEEGIVAFDFAGGGPLLSLADRSYGTLELLATAAGGTRTYNGNSTKDLTIRGNLIMHQGVSFNVTFTGTAAIIVKGSLVQLGGTLNLATGAQNTSLKIGGQLQQQAGIITANIAGRPVIELNGTTPQILAMGGAITNLVTLRINNATGVTLQGAVALPHKLELINGQVITSTGNLLTLGSGCTIAADTLYSKSFINGPLRKEGLLLTDQFVFPVGKGNSHRWLALKEATGNFTVEFFRGNPRLLSSNYIDDLHHISSIEHWTIESDPVPAATARVVLSFDDPNSGGVTNLEALRVSRLSGTSWISAGNMLTGGTAGSNGHVTSSILNTFDVTGKYFTLGSTSASFNPLLLGQNGVVKNNGTFITSATLAPSVTTGNTRLIITAAKRSTVHCTLADAAGRCIAQWTISLLPGTNTIPVHASAWKAGIYTIVMRHANKPATSVRLIKQ